MAMQRYEKISDTAKHHFPETTKTAPEAETKNKLRLSFSHAAFNYKYSYTQHIHKKEAPHHKMRGLQYAEKIVMRAYQIRATWTLMYRLQCHHRE